MKQTALLFFTLLNALNMAAQVFVKATTIEQIGKDTECIFVSGNYAAGEILTPTFLNREEVKLNDNGSIQSVSNACIYTIKGTSTYRGLMSNNGKYLITDNNYKFSYSSNYQAEWKLEKKNGGVVISPAANYYLMSSNYKDDGHKFQVHLKVATNDYAYVYIIKNDDVPPPPPEDPTITIGDGKDDNAAIIKAYNHRQVDVEIDRTFLNDGGWYTLCLPFDITADELRETLKAEELMTLHSSSTDDNGGIELYFQPAYEAQAGKPYLLKVSNDVCNPVFKSKTITATEPLPITAYDQKQQACLMKGIYDPLSFANSEVIDQVRFISGSDGVSLRKPSEEGHLKGLRAYFVLPKGVANAYIKNTTDDWQTVTVRTNVSTHPMRDLSGKIVIKPNAGIIIVNGKKYQAISLPTP